MTNNYTDGQISDYLTEHPQITYNKLVYRRHTDFDNLKEKYRFKNNQVFVPYDDKISIIQTICLSDMRNVSKIYCLLVPTDVKIINKDIIYSNRGIIVLDVFTYSTLKFYNKATYRKNKQQTSSRFFTSSPSAITNT